MLPKYLKENDKVLFIPYTTDDPELKIGYIKKDFYGKSFIAYDGIYCDDGEWYICEADNIKDNIDTLNIKLNYAIREYLKNKAKEN